MSCHARLGLIFLLAPVLCGRVAHGQPQPVKYASIESKDASVTKVLFSPGGETLNYIFNQKTIVNWDVKTKQAQKAVYKADTQFNDMAYSPDGRMLAVAEITKVWHIDVRTGARTYLYRHGEEAAPIRYSHDGKRILSCGMDGRIRVWDVGKKAELGPFDPKGMPMDVVEVPGTDQLLAAVSVETQKPNDPSSVAITRKLVAVDRKTAKAKTLNDNTLAFSLGVSPDGKLVAVIGEDIEIKASSTLDTDAKLECPLNALFCCFSETGRFLIVGGTRKGPPTGFDTIPGEVGIYDRDKKKWVSHFGVLDDQVSSMDLSLKDNLLAVCTSKLGTITIWDLSPVIGNLPKDKAGKKADEKRR